MSKDCWLFVFGHTACRIQFPTGDQIRPWHESHWTARAPAGALLLNVPATVPRSRFLVLRFACLGLELRDPSLPIGTCWQLVRSGPDLLNQHLRCNPGPRIHVHECIFRVSFRVFSLDLEHSRKILKKPETDFWEGGRMGMESFWGRNFFYFSFWILL